MNTCYVNTFCMVLINVHEWHANLFLCALLLNDTVCNFHFFEKANILIQKEFFLKRMIEFKISAPGRIILSGEYAAMYGKEVVITTIDRRTTLQFTELINDSRGICKIEFPDVDLSLNLPLELVKDFLSSYTIIGQDLIRLCKYVQYFIISNGMWSTYEQKFSLQMFFFSLYYMVHQEQLDIRPFHVHVTTEIPMNAGLGSSTSFAVCLASCFLHWSRLQRGDHNVFSMQEKLRILKAATHCRKGIESRYLADSAMSICGSRAMKYQVFGYSLHSNRFFSQMLKMKILLINSTVRQNKYEEREHMALLKYLCPEFTDHRLDNINETSRIISETLSEMAISLRNNNIEALLRQFIMLQTEVVRNQNQLYELGLSNEMLNLIFETAYIYGYRSVGKLTGTGENKFAYILLQPGMSQGEIDTISAHIESHNFPVMLTSIGCGGLRIEN